MKMKQTYSLLLDIFNSIEKTFYIDSVESLGNKLYVLNSCDTLWATKGYKVVIDDVQYTITDVLPNEWIKVKGNQPITAKSFELYDAIFRHGTIMATNAELSATKNDIDKYPMVFMHEKTSERLNHDELSNISMESRCTFYCLVPCDIENWVITDHDRYAIQPMRNLMSRFLYAIRNNSNVYADGLAESEWRDENKFGVYVSSQGQTKNIFADNLSGVGVEANIPFYESQCDSDCETSQPQICEPVEVIDQEGNRIEFVNPGEQYIVLSVSGFADLGEPYQINIISI